MKTFRFRGKRFKIHTVPLNGVCDNPSRKNPQIHIFADLNKKVGLTTCIHEALHAENWDASEGKVTRTAAVVASFLWKLGFRKVVG